MQLQRPGQTPIRAALAAVFLRGGGVDESRDASPPGTGAPAEQANRRLTSAKGSRVYNLPAASGQRPAASGQRPAA